MRGSRRLLLASVVLAVGAGLVPAEADQLASSCVLTLTIGQYSDSCTVTGAQWLEAAGVAAAGDWKYRYHCSDWSFGYGGGTWGVSGGSMPGSTCTVELTASQGSAIATVVVV
jgi:hypothetical protein